MYHEPITKEQRKSLHVLYQRSPDGAKTYREFRKRAIHAIKAECLMIQWCNMWIGIENDGYRHS